MTARAAFDAERLTAHIETVQRVAMVDRRRQGDGSIRRLSCTRVTTARPTRRAFSRTLDELNGRSQNLCRRAICPQSFHKALRV
jgi:hypothetical protein